MEPVNRRTFIKNSMMASAGVAVGAPAYIKNFVRNKPNDIINVAVIGINSQGGTHYRNFAKIPDCRVAALCDCVDYLLPGAVEQVEKLGTPKPKTYSDYRRLLEDKDIDAVSIAAPGYWHALMTINACQAGKDVYCEKPASWNIDEGRKMVQAARKYNRIVQVGLQYRSSRITQEAIRLLREGVIGNVYMGRGTVYRHRQTIGRKPDSEIPKGVDWDLFRGPAPMIPFNENHFLYNWHWFWDTSTGEFGNNGIHAMDRIRLGMDINEHPVKISCSGGFYAYDSDQEVPNLQVATFEYANGAVMELEVRSLYTPGDDNLLWLGTKGYAVLGNNFQVFHDSSTEPMVTRGASKEPAMIVTEQDLSVDSRRAEFEKNGVNMHYVNFLDSIRNRNYKDLSAEINEGYISTAQMHLGNIAYRTGRKLVFDGKTEKFTNDDDANNYLTRPEGGRKPFNIPDKV
jgi:predicted dehydrogenase